MTYCQNCGMASEAENFCGRCGTQLATHAVTSGPTSTGQGPSAQMGQPIPQQYATPYGAQALPVESKKTLAGVLGIFLGSLGIHKFVLGYTTEGILAIVITVFTCGFGGIIGLIEGIIYLTKSDEEFVRTYQLNKRGWF